jgi:K+-transporting ATPase ATPase A chain
MIQNFKPTRSQARRAYTILSSPSWMTKAKPFSVQTAKPVMEDQTVDEQLIVQGPMASQVAIKMLGTNGGGYTNANAAHPFENPTPLSNFLQMLSIFASAAG